MCQTGCPIDNQIPRFIHAIAQGNFGVANEILAERTNLPSICGRVCPREAQCEGNCIMNRMKKPPINIGKLERFAADFESINDLRKPKKIKQEMDALPLSALARQVLVWLGMRLNWAMQLPCLKGKVNRVVF